jgi:hypothetical protein
MSQIRFNLGHSTETGRICPDGNEPVVQREQLEVHKKAATAAKKMAASPSPAGSNSLFGYRDDLDKLAPVSEGER